MPNEGSVAMSTWPKIGTPALRVLTPIDYGVSK